MAIPLAYNFRSVLVRQAGTAMAIASVAATVAVFVSVMALAQGLEKVFSGTGHPLNLVVIREGSQVETNSSLPVPALQTLRYLPGIAKDPSGEPLVSPELLVLVFIPRAGAERKLHAAGGADRAHVVLRGTTPAGLLLREQVRVVEGRVFRGGMRELVLSRTLGRRFALGVGSTINLGRGDWQVVGLTDGAGTAYDSELWTDVASAADDFNRSEIYSSVLLRATDSAAAAGLAVRIGADRRLHLQARPEQDYFRDQMRTSMPIKILGRFIALVMAVGACFAAMNAMYASVAFRTREIATLRVLGFTRISVLIAFVVESVLLALAGGVLGCLLALPVNGLSTGTMSFYTFSEIAFHFRITPGLLAQGLMFAAGVGLAGGFLPAQMAARRPLLAGLRG